MACPLRFGPNTCQIPSIWSGLAALSDKIYLGVTLLPVRGMAYEWRCTFRENGHRTWTLRANISKTMHDHRWKIGRLVLFEFSLVYNGGIHLRFVARGTEYIFHMINFAIVQLQKASWSQVSMKECKCIDLEQGGGGSCNRKLAAVGECCIGLESVPIWMPEVDGRRNATMAPKGLKP
jgi:hypothetical protein